MVEIGGEIRTRGDKDGKEWKVGVETPDAKLGQRPIQKILKLSNLSIATSGSYRNFFEQGGKKYSHTIDFKTGRPIQHNLISVSVIHQKSCTLADSWATALMAMGVRRGMRVAEMNKIPAYFIYRDPGQKKDSFVTKSTAAFKAIFKE
jgi:thiamine biosynthesis lipoprotein